jgi:hypothetical protein
MFTNLASAQLARWMGIPGRATNDAASQEVSPVTLPGYFLALTILLGSLALPAAVFYAMLHLKRLRQAPTPRGQEQ